MQVWEQVYCEPLDGKFFFETAEMLRLLLTAISWQQELQVAIASSIRSLVPRASLKFHNVLIYILSRSNQFGKANPRRRQLEPGLRHERFFCEIESSQPNAGISQLRGAAFGSGKLRRDYVRRASFVCSL